MSKTRSGQSAALKATYSDPIAARLHRRAGEQGISYEIDEAGRCATVYRVQKQGGAWLRHDLGAVRGADPMNTYINVALAHTQHDGELFSLIAAQIERRTDDVLDALKDFAKRLDVVLDDLDRPLTRLALQYV